MKEYELTVLIQPDLESNLDAPLKTVRDIITRADGKITSEDMWGKKRLQYKINGEDFAVYAYFELELPVEAPLKISNALNITDDVLRYLLVKADKKINNAAKEAAKKAESESK